MQDIAIKLENISKQYRLGEIGTGTLQSDLQRWWWKVRGKGDPTLKVGSVNRLDTVDGEYVWALQDINLDIKKGEILGIIGKNGAGKSTLLKILSRVTGPTTGQIKVNGRIASLLEVGTGFNPELTGRENVFLNGAILGMTKAEIRKKLDEIIEFAGVAKYIDTPVKRYSSGMRVRLGFAVAAFLEPEILVVDEVLAVGDAEFQKKAIGKMQDISKGENGRTVLFVSHNMASVKALCTTGILMENGKISQIGSIDDIVDSYLKSNNADKVILSQNYERNNSHVKYIGIQTEEGRQILFSDDKIKFKIEFYLDQDYKDLDLNIAFWNVNVKLFMFFASKLANKGLSQSAPFQKGLNILSFELPFGILPSDRYYVHFALHRNYKDLLHTQQNAIIFDIIDNTNFMNAYRTANKSLINLDAVNIHFENR